MPWQRNGDNLVRSSDGRSWELVSAPDGIAGGYSALTVVDDRVVATGSTGLWETDDAGLTWEPIAPLPADFAESGPGPLSVGPLGFLATPVYGVWDEAPPPPVIQFSIERDGRTLTIGADRLTVTATDGSAIVELPVRGPVWDSLEPPDGFVFDHETGTATVVEPVTARPVFTVTYREFDEAFLAAVRAADPEALARGSYGCLLVRRGYLDDRRGRRRHRFPRMGHERGGRQRRRVDDRRRLRLLRPQPRGHRPRQPGVVAPPAGSTIEEIEPADPASRPFLHTDGRDHPAHCR